MQATTTLDITDATMDAVTISLLLKETICLAPGLIRTIILEACHHQQPQWLNPVDPLKAATTATHLPGTITLAQMRTLAIIIASHLPRMIIQAGTRETISQTTVPADGVLVTMTTGTSMVIPIIIKPVVGTTTRTLHPSHPRLHLLGTIMAKAKAKTIPTTKVQASARMVKSMITQDEETILMEETAVPATADTATPITLTTITTIKAEEIQLGEATREATQEAILASMALATVLTTSTPPGLIQPVLRAPKKTSPETVLPPSGTSLERANPVVRVVRAVQASTSMELLDHTTLPSLPEAGLADSVQSCHVTKERPMDGRCVEKFVGRNERS